MFKELLLTGSVLCGIVTASSAQGTPQISTFNIWGDSCVLAPSMSPNSMAAMTLVSNYNASSSVEYHWGDGSSGTGTSTGSQGYFYASHIYATAGTYTVAAVLYDGVTPIDTSWRTVNAFCSIISGFAYKRADNNCDHDAATEPLLSTAFDIEVRKAGVPVDTIVANGHLYKYINSADLTSVFSLHPINLPMGMTLACPSSPHSFKFDTLDYFNFPGFAFAFDCDPTASGFDLSVTGSGFFRPVANSYMYLYPRNAACLPQNGTVTLQLSPKYSFVSANPAPTNVSGNTISWDVNALSNTDHSLIGLTLNAVGTLTLGDTVQNHVTITPISGDMDPANNTILMIDSIRASFDPNEKHASPIGDIAQGELMTYTIHFENLGNDTAFNIHIMDTLSAHLDAGSFRLITSSHPVSHQILGTGSDKTLRFDLANIQLPDASAPEHNKGFVTYQIAAKTGLALGTMIENTAHIYFDINPAIVTNTTRNKIPETLSIGKTGSMGSIKVFPNPAHDKLFVAALKDLKAIRIVNTLGQEMTIAAEAATEFISIAHLPTGVYFLKAEGKEGSFMQKFIKN